MIETILTWLIVAVAIFAVSLILGIFVGKVIRFGSGYPGMNDIEL